MNISYPRSTSCILVCIACFAVSTEVILRPESSVQAQERFVGGIRENADDVASTPRPVRNDAAQPGEEIVTLRTFHITKGSFPEFLKASEEGVWPYFEKLGSRVIGMWVETYPDETNSRESTDHDTVYLMTRYASMDHWRASRDMATHGGNGPDWEACQKALDIRRELTIDSTVVFLKGRAWDNKPWFMPGLDETYQRSAPVATPE